MIGCIILILITLGLVLFLAFGPNDTASSGLFFVEAAVNTKPCFNPKFERIDGKCLEPCRNGRDPTTKKCIRKPKTPAVVAQPTVDKPAVVTKPPVKPTVDTLPSVENCKKINKGFDSKSKTCVEPPAQPGAKTQADCNKIRPGLIALNGTCYTQDTVPNAANCGRLNKNFVGGQCVPRPVVPITESGGINGEVCEMQGKQYINGSCQSKPSKDVCNSRGMGFDGVQCVPRAV